MIDLKAEELVPLSRVPALLPSSRAGRRVHIATIWRWASAGRLETLKVGGTRYTSMEALARFAQPGLPSTTTVPKTRGRSARRDKDVAAAERRLAKRGVTCES